MTGPELFEDVYYEICNRLVDTSGLQALQALAVSCKLLSSICRQHLFKRVTLDVHQTQDIIFFGRVLDRDPRTAFIIREICIRDSSPPVQMKSWPSHAIVGYGNVTNDWSPLSLYLARLKNINTANISFTYTFWAHSRTALGWTELSETLRALILRPDVKTIRLEGVRHIPLTASSVLAQKQFLELSRCTFKRATLLDIAHLAPTPCQTKLKSIKITFPTVDDVVDPIAEELSPVAQWWLIHYFGIASLPPILAIDLTLGAYNSIAEAARFLSVFTATARRVAIDTSQACLEALQVRELYDMARDGKLASWPLVSSLRIACIPAILSLGHGTPRSGNDNVALDLRVIDMGLASCAQPTAPLEMLSYRIMNWDRTLVTATLTAPTAPATTEFSWLVSSIQSLPQSRNNTINTLKLDFVIGTHMQDAQRSSNALTALVNDDEWHVLAEALKTQGWSALRQIELSVDIPGKKSAGGEAIDVLWESAGAYLVMLLRARLRQDVHVFISPCTSS